MQKDIFPPKEVAPAMCPSAFWAKLAQVVDEV